MNRLFLETSTTQASVALFAGDDLIAEAAFPSGRSPHSPLFRTLEAFLKKVATLDEIIVGVGPGSYSGIRIGISAAIGLQIARKIPARGTHSALGYSGEDFQVILDARGSWIYTAVRGGLVEQSPIHCTREELEKKIDAALPLYSPNLLPGLFISPSYPHAAILGQRRITENLPLQPLYLKAPHITVARIK